MRWGLAMGPEKSAAISQLPDIGREEGHGGSSPAKRGQADAIAKAGEDQDI